jgi:hypothetical protein
MGGTVSFAEMIAFGGLLLVLGLGIGSFVGYTRGWAANESLTKWVTDRISEKEDHPELILGDVVTAISNANTTRQHGNLIRRLMKIVEEMGEVAEAYLNVTSAGNGKKKTWDDVREELADVVIVAVDCALTPMPDHIEQGLTPADVAASFAAEVSRKLAKWQKNRDTGKAATDAE